MEVASLGQVEDLQDRLCKLEKELDKLLHYLHVPRQYKIDYNTFDTLEEAKKYYNDSLERWNKLHPKPTRYQSFYLPIYVVYNLPEVSNEI